MQFFEGEYPDKGSIKLVHSHFSTLILVKKKHNAYRMSSDFLSPSCPYVDDLLYESSDAKYLVRVRYHQVHTLEQYIPKRNCLHNITTMSNKIGEKKGNVDFRERVH